MAAPPAPPPAVLLPELLGFVPQFLLDDIIDTANDSVRQAVEAMEAFLRRWVDNRAQNVGEEWDPSQDLEQGLVAFQTLLYSHVDVAFDFFEVWSKRNIFAVPPELPIVAPHQRGLDLTTEEKQEQELVDEIEELRRKIHAQRKLRRVFNHAVQKSALQRSQSEKRLQRLSFLNQPQLKSLSSLPPAFHAMYEAVANLPPHEVENTSVLPPIVEPGKRPWETSRSGYLSWAIDTLVNKASRDGSSSSAAVGKTAEEISQVGSSLDIKGALDALGDGRHQDQDQESMDTS
ncbi:Mis12-domain-containing protein [Panus rudis PR-1116 ss-1]|nr:Mis12-domain-containing protein [Panus rudis PR-1116 ss-1]